MYKDLPSLWSCKIAVIGLGYVGLPLAVEFSSSKKCFRTGTSTNHEVVGFDIDLERLSELSQCIDRTNEVSSAQLLEISSLSFSNLSSDLSSADVFIITVPTPIDVAKNPDLTYLKEASSTVGKALKSRAEKDSSTAAVVIYESTVYPGATEEVCVPILEETSGSVYNLDFVCGYSPERINPGDKNRRLVDITKVTSGSTKESAEWIDALYGSIINAGTHLTANIKTAEAAKVIENTQRDLNIALVNELAIIFAKLGIDTLDVIKAASSKWNFLPFTPGLVGGHCIGVDPYYLTHKAAQIGYHPEVVLAGRRINDRMGEWIAEQVILNLAKRNLPVGGSKVLILGITFKENCRDLRNTKVLDIIKTLEKYSVSSIVVDPWACHIEAWNEYGIELCTEDVSLLDYQAIVLAVAHDQFKQISLSEWMCLSKGKILFDVKGIIPRQLKPVRL